MVPQKGKGGLSCSLTLVSWLADEWISPQTRHCEKPKSMKETLQILCLPVTSRTANTRRMFQSGAETINRCGFLSLSTGKPHIFTNTQTHIQRLTVPQWLPPYTQYTHHNDLARPTPCWGIYLLHSNLPLGFDNSSFMPLWRCRGTTPCLSVHLSIHLSVLPCHTVAWMANRRLSDDPGSEPEMGQ